MYALSATPDRVNTELLKTLTGIGFDARRPCPEHNVLFCSTCTTLEGECDWGGCEADGLSVVDTYSGRRLVESRLFCLHHAAIAVRLY